MYCRGHRLREEIVQQFEVKPLGRFKLLNGQSVISNAGNMDIEDEYTIFDCIDRKNSEHHETINCSKYVAEDFCSLSGYTLPPLFNPLKSTGFSSTHSSGNSNSKVSWNKIRKQLYDCTLLIIIYFENSSNNRTLLSIKNELEDSKYIGYFPKKQVKAINTYLYRANITFQTILNKLSKNNDLRDFRYDLILEYLNKLDIEQHFV